MLNSYGYNQPAYYSVCGCVAAIISAVITTPFDVLKTKLMTRKFETPNTVLKEFLK